MTFNEAFNRSRKCLGFSGRSLYIFKSCISIKKTLYKEYIDYNSKIFNYCTGKTFRFLSVVGEKFIVNFCFRFIKYTLAH